MPGGAARSGTSLRTQASASSGVERSANVFNIWRSPWLGPAHLGVLRSLSLPVAAINLRRLVTMGLDHNGIWGLA